ncbi:expressed unknown protein [Seminavis robusta]|uniref:Uncharacterized protein n=1 Tax=Seminavis robusta TaxID=568900 RepID=A0A9N8HEH0_9STRA|nr:expressed unknown protein [Seminavis robusta]|eukprot:Sro303_g112460.1 n/a (143) ;mRNA; f:54625-55053
MDHLLSKAGKCGLDSDLADLAIGGFLHVLKVSEQEEEAALKPILDYLGDDARINLKQYEKNMDHKGFAFPTPIRNLLHKPPSAKEKDAQHTKQMIDALDRKFEGCSPAKLVKFMKLFIAYLEENVTEAVDLDAVLQYSVPKK